MLPPLKVLILPPASLTIMCPAAISHSDVGPNRGYISALPSAIKQNFNELPAWTISAPGYLSLTQSSNIELEWDLLPIIRTLLCNLETEILFKLLRFFYFLLVLIL